MICEVWRAQNCVVGDDNSGPVIAFCPIIVLYHIYHLAIRGTAYEYAAHLGKSPYFSIIGGRVNG